MQKNEKEICETSQRSTISDVNNTMKDKIEYLGIVKDVWFPRDRTGIKTQT